MFWVDSHGVQSLLIDHLQIGFGQSLEITNLASRTQACHLYQEPNCFQPQGPLLNPLRTHSDTESISFILDIKMSLSVKETICRICLSYIYIYFKPEFSFLQDATHSPGVCCCFKGVCLLLLSVNCSVLMLILPDCAIQQSLEAHFTI